MQQAAGKSIFRNAALLGLTLLLGWGLSPAQAQYSYRPGHWHESFGATAYNVGIPFRPDGGLALQQNGASPEDILLRVPVRYVRVAELAEDLKFSWQEDNEFHLVRWDKLKGVLIFEEAPNGYRNYTSAPNESLEVGYYQTVPNEQLMSARWIYCGLSEGMWRGKYSETTVCLEDRENDGRFERAFVAAFNGPHSMSIFQVAELEGADFSASYTVSENEKTRFAALLSVRNLRRDWRSRVGKEGVAAGDYYFQFGIGLMKLTSTSVDHHLPHVPAPRFAYPVIRKIEGPGSLKARIFGTEIQLEVDDAGKVNFLMEDDFSSDVFVYRRGECKDVDPHEIVGCGTRKEKE